MSAGLGALAVLVLAAAPDAPATAPAARASSARGTVEGQVKLEVKSLAGASEVQGADAVVFLEWLAGAGAQPAQSATMVQRDKTFEPRLLLVPQGSLVSFPNDDLVFHNVFSLSQGNEFDLGLYRKGTTKAVRFNKPGVVDVFCNIHPEMIASILVLQNPYAARVGAGGRYSLQLPAGKHTLVAYWPAGAVERREIDVPAGGKVTADFTLVDSGRSVRHPNKFQQPYGRYK
jgi:plastocyanin